MKAKDLTINQLCVFKEKEKVRILKTVSSKPNHLKQVPVKQVIIDINTGSFKLSPFTTGLKLNDEVMLINNSID